MDSIDNPVAPDCGCAIAERPDPRVCDPALDDEPDDCETIVDPDPHAISSAFFQVTIWSDTFGVPGSIVAGPYRSDFDDGAAADVNTGVPIAGDLIGIWGFTGDSIGFGTPTFLETGVNLRIPDVDQVQLNASQCYWLNLCPGASPQSGDH